MFNSIAGRLSEKRSDSICIETGGIEWEIAVPARSVDDFGPAGTEVRAFTWLHHYEDGMRLYGFLSVSDRSVFMELMKVEGIGAKQALRILSGIRPESLARALDEGDLAALQRVPGVGPKMAQKMMLALKGRLVRIDDDVVPASSASRGEWGDVIRALVDMGFGRPQVEKSVRVHSAAVPEGTEREREIFRRALIELSAGG